MTQAEWVDVFSALMTGADLSYPDRSHQVVWNLLRNLEFPISMEQYGTFGQFFGHSWVKQVGAALALTVDAAQMHNFVYSQGAGATGDYINTDPIMLAKGSYLFRYVYVKNPGFGISKIGAFDGAGHTVAIASVDQYNAAVTLRNQVAFGFFNLPNAGAWSFDKLINTKNAASVGFGAQFTLLEIARYAV